MIGIDFVIIGLMWGGVMTLWWLVKFDKKQNAMLDDALDRLGPLVEELRAKNQFLMRCMERLEEAGIIRRNTTEVNLQ